MAIPQPPIQWVGTAGQNIWVGRGDPQKIAIVAHIMDGSLAGCISWFRDPAAKASSNYGVGRDGTIVCFVDPTGDDAPFANGIIDGPDATFNALSAAKGGTNPNYWTVSIEHEGKPGNVMPPAQLAASGWLAAWLCERFGIPVDEDHLLGHYEIDSHNRPNCPGWNRDQWVAWEASIADHAKPAPTPVPSPVIAAAIKTIELALKQIEQATNITLDDLDESPAEGAP